MTDAIHPSALIGDGVRMGRGAVVGPGAVIVGPCDIGDECWIGPNAVVGGPPEMTTAEHGTPWYEVGGSAGVQLGHGSVVREGAVITQGSHRPTSVGPGSWILTRAYLAHDVVLGARSTVSAGVSIGGHCELGEGVNVGMNAAVHQRRVIGPGAMIGMSSAVTRDIPPFAKAYGVPARVQGVNTIALSRTGIPDAVGRALSESYGSGRIPSAEELPDLAVALGWWAARSVTVEGEIPDAQDGA